MKFLKKKKQFEVEEIDITSLLDVLVILLVFLLQNMTNSELTLDLIKNLALPYSVQKGISENGTVIQVNAAREIYINNEPVGVMSSSGSYSGDLVKRLKLIAADYNKKLEQKKKEGDKKPFQGHIINLVFDKSLDYKLIDKILKSTAMAGFTQFKFIVQGTE